MSRETEWQTATAEFLTTTPEGKNWKGGNLNLIGYLLRANGLAETDDKVAALKSVAAEMHNRGLDVSPPQKMQVDTNALPAEIIEKWKAAYGDPVKIGEAFHKFFKK